QLADGRPRPDGLMVLKPSVTPKYFDVMGIRLLAGRSFAEHDDASAPGVAIVSRIVADKLWPGGNAVGQRISIAAHDPAPSDWLTIVGVVDDIRQFDVKSPMPAIYVPLAQSTEAFMLSHMNFASRVSGNPLPVESAIRGVLHDVDPLQPVGSVSTMQAVVSRV